MIFVFVIILDMLTFLIKYRKRFNYWGENNIYNINIENVRAEEIK